MVALRKIPVVWQGTASGSGVSTFYSSDAADITAAIKTFFAACNGGIPNNITWEFPTDGDVIDDATGTITGVWSGGVGGTGGGVSPQPWAAGSGAVVEWLTGAIVAGRKVRGRTFLVPLSVDNYDDQGSILPANIAQYRNAGNALIASAGTDFRVWSRPFTPKPGDTRPPRVGSSSSVLSARVPDLAAVLRRRRARR